MLVGTESRAPLLGREAEVELLTGLLDDVERSGTALVLRGEPGTPIVPLAAARDGYRIYPKLGISARREVATALSETA
jgi:hypothetical protein